jgi:serine/threonine protein kinase
LHSFDVFHRDIKPENILLACINERICEEDAERVEEKKVIKFIDFGTSKNVSQSNNTIFVGSKGKMAPEIYEQFKKEDEKPLEKREYFGENYDLSCDVFSLGITFAELWEGNQQMIDGNKDPQVKSLTKHQNECVFKKIEEMIKGCCRKNPNHRWKIEDVVKTLVELKDQ